MANRYSADDLMELIKISPPNFHKDFLRIFVKTKGTMLDEVMFKDTGALEFLAADFKDVPKFMNKKYTVLIRWRLMIGR